MTSVELISNLQLVFEDVDTSVTGLERASADIERCLAQFSAERYENRP